jgi:hypothetical protein
MARPAQIVGFAPVGFLAVAVAAAVATVASGWTAKSSLKDGGYGVSATVNGPPVMSTAPTNP